MLVRDEEFLSISDISLKLVLYSSSQLIFSYKMIECIKKAKILLSVCLTLSLIVSLSLTTHSSLAGAQNRTLMQPQGIQVFDSGGFIYLNPKMFREPLLKMLIRVKLISWL